MTSSIGIIVAHPDDEVLGCGGTIARFAKEGYQIQVIFLADGETSRSTNNNSHIDYDDCLWKRLISAEKALSILGDVSIQAHSLPDNRLDGIDILDIIHIIEKYIEQYTPRIIFTHHSGDVNIDHRIVHDAVVAACRPQPDYPVKELLFFEVPSSTEWRPAGSMDMFNPNLFIDISDTLHLKLEAMKCYHSELREFPHPRSIKAIEALATWRGATAGLPAAEAFIIGRKII